MAVEDRRASWWSPATSGLPARAGSWEPGTKESLREIRILIPEGEVDGAEQRSPCPPPLLDDCVLGSEGHT